MTNRSGPRAGEPAQPDVSLFLAGDAVQGRRIIARVAARSRPFGTRITFDSARNEGVVEIA